MPRTVNVPPITIRSWFHAALFALSLKFKNVRYRNMLAKAKKRAIGNTEKTF